MLRKRKRLWALLLSAALSVTQLPAVAMAKNNAPEDGSIASFKELPSGVAEQTADVGTELSEWNLPDTVTAEVYHVTEETIPDEDNTEDESGEPSTASPSKAGESVSGNNAGDSSNQDSGKTVTTVTTSTEEIFVTWDSEPDYDSDRLGDYVFTADVGGRVLSKSAKLPQISVTVSADTVENPTENPTGEPLSCTKTEGCTLADGHEGECVTKQPPSNGPLVKTIIGWTFVDDENLNAGELALPGVNMDNQADFVTVVSMLPTQIRAEIEGQAEPATVDITGWSCPEYKQDNGDNWPLTGDYLFTAVLPDGYGCSQLPAVKVSLGGISVMTINDRFSADGLRYKELGPDTVQLIGYDGTKPTGALTIPSSVTKPSNGRAYTVVSVGEFAFDGCSGFTGGLTLPDTITQIGYSAFNGCSGFTGLTLPDTITQIGDYAFAFCSGFTGRLTLPDRLIQIGNLVFYGCSGFTGLTLPNTITQIGSSAFYKCSGFTGGLILPDTLAQIGDSAFYECSGFTGGLILPDTLTQIGGSAFYGCSGFTVYNTSSQAVADLLYNSNTSIAKDLIKVGNNAYVPPLPPSKPKKFSQNDMEYEITGPNTVTLTQYLQPAAASGSLTIPETVTEKSVSYTVTAIGDHAFYGCSGFTGDLTLPNTLTQIGNYAFTLCSGFTGSLTLPNAITRIGISAFYGCSGFTGGLTLPDTITQIENTAFYGCNGFTGSLTLPGTVTQIEGSAFHGCSGFTGSLTLPNTITRIGKSAFYGCSGFTGELTLPDNLTQIGDFVFGGCSGLTSAHLGNNLQKLGAQAFPASLPLFADSPRVQLLINEYLNQDTIADTAWDGAEDVPDGAIATVKQDAAVSGGKRIGREAEITVAGGVTLTVDGTLTVYGSLTVKGTLQINGTLTGSGTLYIEKGGKVEGDISGMRVEYPADMEDAKKQIENHSYTAAQAAAADAAAVKNWITREIAALPGLSATGVTVGEITITSFIPAAAGNAGDPDGTNGSFAFTVPLSKGDGTDQAVGSGSIVTTEYQPTGGDSPSYSGGSPSDSGSSSSEPKPQSSYTITGGKISRSVSRSNLKKLANSAKSLTFRCDQASMTFSPAALKAILAAVPTTVSNITFAAVPADLSAFPDAAKLIGAHPVYNFTISYKDSTGNAVKADVNFPVGSASISLSCVPAAAEITGSLFMVYVDGKGDVTWLDKSSYDAGKMLAEVSHFSTYGVACKTPAPAFTDITGHWAKNEIQWATARGLLAGNGAFGPESAITRREFSAALIKLTSRPSGGLANPDAPLTREQMAVLLAGHAKSAGYAIPAPLGLAAFADGEQISAGAAKDVAAMQRAGIVRGKDGNRFDPQDNATRAEAAATLRRFVEIIIEPATAGGFVRNDFGSWMYVRGGKALNGWQKIGGAWYWFSATGEMAVNTKINGYEIGPDGKRKEQ